MTLGQVYVHFDGLSKYIELTNPWGSGDTDENATPTDRRPPIDLNSDDNMGGIQRFQRAGLLSHPSVQVLDAQHATKEDKDAIAELLGT